MSRYLRHSILLLVLLLALSSVSFAQEREKVEITLWHHWSLNDLMDEIIGNFEAEYPWIKVNQSFSPTAGAADRLLMHLLSNSAPEVMMVRSTYAFQFVTGGSFIALDELAERDGIDLGMFNPGDLRSFQHNNQTYAFPSMSGSAWTNLMFYNKDMMDGAGLDRDQPPQTWEEWRQATLRMTERDDRGNIIQAGSTIPLFSNAVPWNGTIWWSEDWRTAQTVSPEAIETAEFLRDLIFDAYSSYGAYSAFNRYGASFWEGLTGMYFTNNSGFGIAKDSDFDWGATTAPVNSLNPDSRPVNVVSSTWSYAIPYTVEGEKLEAAWLLLKYLTVNEDGGGYFARYQGRPSPVLDFNRHPDYAYNNPYWPVVLEALRYEVTAPPGVMAPMDTAGSVIFNGTAHPHQALADANIKVQEALNIHWALLGQ